MSRCRPDPRASPYAFTYDARGEVTTLTDSNGRTLRYSYDAAGNKTRAVTPDGRTIDYSYDTAGRIKTIIDGGTFRFGYDKLGRRTSLTYPNGDTTTYSYDDDGNLGNLIHKNGKGSVIAANSYTLDKVGNRVTNATPERMISYQYDAIYRLTEALSSAPGYSSNSTGKGGGISNAIQQQKEFYTYAPVGNRVSSDRAKRYLHNQANQLIANGGSYTYDNNGNLIEKATSEGRTAYAWDHENRLVKVATAEGTVAEFRYDPFGRRIVKKVTADGSTTTINHFYDNQSILFEYDDTGAIGNRYTDGPGIDEHLMVTTKKERYYYHADGLGSKTALTDSTGKVVQTYEYDSFGNLKDQKNRVKQPYAYTGREWDKETGLYYYRARYYDPMEGRFISKDPIGFKGGINLYGYTDNNPINSKDPTGLATYSGEVQLTSVGRFVAGGSYLTGTMHTTCVNGKRYVANVRAFIVGAAVGLPVGHTGFDLEVSDDAPGQGNLNNLSGLASMVSLSGAFGLPGASVSQIVLGKAQTRFPLGTQYGIDLSASAGGGWSFVSNVHQEDCCK